MLNLERAQWRDFYRRWRKNGRSIDEFLAGINGHGGGDPLAYRAELSARIDHAAYEGLVSVSCEQMDCDCARWTSSRTVPATVVHVEAQLRSIYEGAEGPVYWVSIDGPDDGAEYESRDLALEAYEDGHPHSVSMARYDEDGPY